MASILLLSKSPRRRELLESVGFRVRSAGVDCEEVVRLGLTPQEVAVDIALQKAEAASGHLDLGGGEAFALTADTVVAEGGEILGKPEDRADAKRMLQRLSGKTHRVCTGFALVSDDGRTETGFSSTDVEFRDLPSAWIDAYLETDEPWDKAGSYGIQGMAGLFVRRIVGSYCNVVGLPTEEVVALAMTLGWMNSLPWTENS